MGKMPILNHPPYLVKYRRLIVIGLDNLSKEVYLVVSLPKIVLDVNIYRLVSKFFKLILKGAALLEQAPYLSGYLHIIRQ